MAFDLGDMLAAGAKGAAAGAVLGPVGAGAGGLLGIGLQFAPELGRLLAGDKGGETAVRVREMVARAAGTNDPDMAGPNLAENSDAALKLRVELAQIVADQEAERLLHLENRIKADLQSEMDARATTVALAKERHPLAYGAAVVTVVLLAAFIYVIVANPPMDEGMKETLKVLTVAAASYWIGSSRGSASKDVVSKSLDAPGRS